jgi:hypothetical protein
MKSRLCLPWQLNKGDLGLIGRKSRDAELWVFQTLTQLDVTTHLNTGVMVLYHADGRVVRAHDAYLEQEAQKVAHASRYTDQADVIEKRDRGKTEKSVELEESVDPKEGVSPKAAKNDTVHIIVDAQSFRELYYGKQMNTLGEWESFQKFDKNNNSNLLPSEGLDRKILMKCSSLVKEFFTFQSDETELHPVSYPRHHVDSLGNGTYDQFISAYGGQAETRSGDLEKRYKTLVDDQMAHLHEDEVTKYIVPWLKEMEEHIKKNESSGKDLNDPLPEIIIPDDLLEMIHLYNCMLQLGIASHFQRPLIDALVLRMYRANLQKCHLDTLEMTVCRFFSRGVPALDPVLNHFIGTYALRSATDRQHSKALKPRTLRSSPLWRIRVDPVYAREDQNIYLSKGTTRRWLEFSDVKPDIRTEFPHDTVSLPPRLEVLGHSIRH